MKISSLILIALLALTTRSYGQWNGFDIYVTPGQWFENSNAYANQANFKKHMVLTQGGITGGNNGIYNDTTIAPEVIKRFLERHYPNVESEGLLILDWESEVFKYIRDYPETDKKFKYAEGQWLALINEVRKLRPNLKLGIYAMPFRGYNDWQKRNYNKPGAIDNIISKIDVITPSFYIGYADEERGADFNIKYLKDMLDISMEYGKRHNKPVIPFIWHRVIAANRTYPRGIMKRETFAEHVNFIKNYSNDGFKASGVLLWDDGYTDPRLKNVEGVANWLKGVIKDEKSYDAFCVSLFKAIVNKVNRDAN